MRILVTGGAGFIGSHVADSFIIAGHEVVVVDNLSTGKREFAHPAAQFIQADITDKAHIQSIIHEVKPEIIDHHAAHIQVGNSVKDPQFDAENNIVGLLHMMEAAKEVGVKKIIMASTGGAMYGDKPLPLDETMKEEPVSPYGVSKKSGELYLNYYHQQYGIPYIALRYANVYGPRQNPHGESGVVAIFAEMLMRGKQPVVNGDGSHTRDYVFVTDVAKANLAALSTVFVGPINIGTGQETSTLQVYEKIAAALGSNLPVIYAPERPGEQVASALSYQKAKEVLGWEPTVFFDQGVAQVAQWYQQQSA